MKENERFSTQSIFQSAFCLCIGLKLSGLDRTNGSKVTFVFEGPDVQKKALGFYNKAKVEAQEYSDKFRTLKEQIFQR